MPQQPLRIAYVSESRQHGLSQGYTFEQCCELIDDNTSSAIISALEGLGHTVDRVGDDTILSQSSRGSTRFAQKIGILFSNASAGFIGTTKQSQVPALLEAYDIPFTFASAQSIATSLNKGLAKMTLDLYGVPTAPFAIVPYLDHNTDSLKIKKQISTAIEQSRYRAKILNSFPLFIKPVSESTSRGVTKISKVHNPSELERHVEILFRQYPGQDIIIEPFLGGREFTVGIIGTGDKARVLGALEFRWHALHTVDVAKSQDTQGASRVKLTPEDIVDFLTHNLKIGHGISNVQSVPDPNDPEVKRACEAALQAWRLLKCRDMGRIDVRSDKFGPDAVPCIMDVNALAGIIPDVSSFCLIAKNAGMSYQDIMEAVIDSAVERLPNSK